MLRRQFIICIMVCAMIALLAACGSGKKSSEEAEMLNKQEIEQLEKEASAQVPAQDDNEETAKQETITQIPVPESDGTKTDTGKYVGQIDSNSIEIKVSGAPDENTPKAFRLSEELKAEFSKMNLDFDDDVIFKYTMNENDQPVIIEIQILK